TQVGTTLSIFSVSGNAAEERFENVAGNSAPAATEHFAKNIEWIVKSSSKSPALFKGCVTESVVSGAFVPIHQHVVSFTEFLKLLLRVRIVRIFVRMKFNGQFAISSFDFFARCR